MSGTGTSVTAYAFLAFAGGLLPLAAVAFARGEARRSTALQGDGPAEIGPPRIVFYANALVTHALLLGAAVVAAGIDDVSLFAPPSVDIRDVGAALATLLAVVGVGELSWRSRSSAERERLWVRRILPRTPVERRVWILVSAGAAIAEEVAYRGAFVAFATSATGSVPLAIFASAVAFAAVHAPQGLAGMGYVFVIAILHHALVLFTGMLVLAIAVHFVYDVVAGLWLAKRHGLTTCCGLHAAKEPSNVRVAFSFMVA